MEIKEKATLFLNQFKDWAVQQSDIKGAAVVGSFARGDYHVHSDIDLTIISTDKNLTLTKIQSQFHYHSIDHSAFEEWGILTSLRIFYHDDLEVEYGVVTDEWTREPLDQGTKDVSRNGFTILVEKEVVFASVIKFLNDV